MQYASTSATRSVAAAGQAQVLERDVVHREEAAGGAVLRRHVPERRPVGQRERGQAVAEVLDELADHADAAQDLGHREHEVGRGRALAQRARQPEAHHLRHEHRQRLTEHRSLGFDPARAPAEHTEAVHHRRVRVGAHEGVGESHAVAVVDDAGEVLEVHLVADAGARRDDLEVAERALAPAQEGIALAVPLELELDVSPEGALGAEQVDLDGMVDHELRRDQRIDLRGVAAQVGDRIAHRGQIDHRGHTGEVLHQDTRRRKRDLVGRLGLGVPARDRLDVGVVAVPKDVLEQHAQGVRKPGHVVRGLKLTEAVDAVRAVPDA